MEAQQFHLKWNNHSLNTLSSFQHLLDTNTLVDVSLTCSNGKTVTAHRMVLAACSEYFYRLFKTLPEKHPVIVFKDAGEEIVRDLLLFMYKGEVEVQESYLNDFLKFADTLQVKGLTQSDRPENASCPPPPMPPSMPQQQPPPRDLSTKGNKQSNINNNINSPVKDQPISLVKNSRKNVHTPPTPLQPPIMPIPPHMSDMTKSYIANLSKFSPLLPLPTDGPAPDFMTQLSSPNLYRALQRKYPENPAFLKNMPLFKKMFGENAENFAAAAAAAAAMGFPPPPMPPHHFDDDGDSLSDRPTPPPNSAMSHHMPDENGMERHGANSPMDSDSPYPPSSGPESLSGDMSGMGGPGSHHKGSPLRGTSDKNSPLSKNKSSGRGSRLERMIAAEYKIISEYSENAPQEVLPVMTPELMKSRRTHSLQLAIGEILHNRASVQSAATKYHIPRETLRRHYQRYLKAMGINKPLDPADERTTNSVDSIHSQTVATNNNGKGPEGLPGQPDEPSNGFSSLMDIGQAYGIWNPDVDGANFKVKGERNAANIDDKDDKQKLVIDEEEDIDDDEDDEPLSPGGPEEEEMETAAPPQLGPVQGLNTST